MMLPSKPDITKFTPINTERPKTRGRPPKHYHPLLQKEKQLEVVVRKILPKPIADTVCRKGSRLAHLYGLPKTHKQQLSMRPILSSTGTYNFALAKWLEEKLKTLSLNQHTICDIFSFAEEIRETSFNPMTFLCPMTSVLYLPTCHSTRLLRSSPRKPLKTTGLMKRMISTSQRQALPNF